MSSRSIGHHDVARRSGRRTPAHRTGGPASRRAGPRPATPRRWTGPPAAVNADATSSLGSTPKVRSTWFAIQLRAVMIGEQEPAEPDQRRAEPHDGLVRPGHREVLRHHLAQHDVQVHHDGEGDDERDRVGERRRSPRRACSGSSMRWASGGLGDDAEARRAHGHAELGAREHERHVLHRPQDGLGAPVPGLGERLDGASAARRGSRTPRRRRRRCRPAAGRPSRRAVVVLMRPSSVRRSPSAGRARRAVRPSRRPGSARRAPAPRRRRRGCDRARP